MTMNALKTVEGSRCLLLLQHLQAQLKALIPNTKDFFDYRNELLQEENSPEIDELLSCEHELRSKMQYLSNRMHEVKDEDKRKDLVCTRAALQTTEKKSKDVSKQLNRILVDSKSIVENHRKIQSIIHWMKQKLNIDVDNRLLCLETPISRKTALSKFRDVFALYSSLQGKLREEKERALYVESKVNELATVQDEVNQIERRLSDYCGGSVSSVLERKSRFYEKKESSLREYQIIEESFHEESGETPKVKVWAKITLIHLTVAQNPTVIIKQAIEMEEKKQVGLISSYKNEILSTKNKLDQIMKSWDTKAIELNDQLKETNLQRDNNLRILLKLKLSWKQLENNKMADIANKERLKREHELKERQHQAATILQNKIKVMYLSKLKKKRTKAGGKKKVQKGKKKKK